MARRALGTKSIRSLLAVRFWGWVWIGAELRAKNARKRYQKAYMHRYGYVSTWEEWEQPF